MKFLLCLTIVVVALAQDRQVVQAVCGADLDDDCASWLVNGYPCDHSWSRANCQTTCCKGLVGGKQPACPQDVHPDCASWVVNGYPCDNTWSQENCQTTCCGRQQPSDISAKLSTVSGVDFEEIKKNVGTILTDAGVANGNVDAAVAALWMKNQNAVGLAKQAQKASSFRQGLTKAAEDGMQKALSAANITVGLGRKALKNAMKKAKAAGVDIYAEEMAAQREWVESGLKAGTVDAELGTAWITRADAEAVRRAQKAARDAFSQGLEKAAEDGVQKALSAANITIGEGKKAYHKAMKKATAAGIDMYAKELAAQREWVESGLKASNVDAEMGAAWIKRVDERALKEALSQVGEDAFQKALAEANITIGLGWRGVNKAMAKAKAAGIDLDTKQLAAQREFVESGMKAGTVNTEVGAEWIQKVDRKALDEALFQVSEDALQKVLAAANITIGQGWKGRPNAMKKAKDAGIDIYAEQLAAQREFVESGMKAGTVTMVVGKEWIKKVDDKAARDFLKQGLTKAAEDALQKALAEADIVVGQGRTAMKMAMKQAKAAGIDLRAKQLAGQNEFVESGIKSGTVDPEMGAEWIAKADTKKSKHNGMHMKGGFYDDYDDYDDWNDYDDWDYDGHKHHRG